MAMVSVEPPENHGKGQSKKSQREKRRREDLFKAQEGKCYWCRDPMEMNHHRLTPMGRLKENPAFASFEHLIPKSHGGLTGFKNIVLSHVACNGKRHLRRWPHDPIYGRESNPVLKAAFEKAQAAKAAYIGPAPGWRRE